MTGVAYGNNTTATIGYDAYGHQSSISYGKAGGTITSDAATYSLAGRQTTDTVGMPSGSALTISYCYDGAGRLTSVNGPSGCSSAATSSYRYASNPSSDNCASLAASANVGQGANTNRTSGNSSMCSGSASFPTLDSQTLAHPTADAVPPLAPSGAAFVHASP